MSEEIWQTATNLRGRIGEGRFHFGQFFFEGMNFNMTKIILEFLLDFASLNIHIPNFHHFWQKIGLKIFSLLINDYGIPFLLQFLFKSFNASMIGNLNGTFFVHFIVVTIVLNFDTKNVNPKISQTSFLPIKPFIIVFVEKS